MKHDQLRSIAHNLADSLASNCFIIGFASIDMIAEAKANTEGEVVVDFLTGRILGRGSPELHEVMASFAKVIPDFCEKNGVDFADIASLTAKFSARSLDLRTEVVVVDHMGRRTTDRYDGIPLKRPKVLDALGRLRPLGGRSN